MAGFVTKIKINRNLCFKTWCQSSSSLTLDNDLIRDQLHRLYQLYHVSWIHVEAIRLHTSEVVSPSSLGLKAEKTWQTKAAMEGRSGNSMKILHPTSNWPFNGPCLCSIIEQARNAFKLLKHVLNLRRLSSTHRLWHATFHPGFRGNTGGIIPLPGQDKVVLTSRQSKCLVGPCGFCTSEPSQTSPTESNRVQPVVDLVSTYIRPSPRSSLLSPIFILDFSTSHQDHQGTDPSGHDIGLLWKTSTWST